MHGDQAATIRIIRENVAQLHRDARARIRKWVLDGFDARGKAESKEPDAGVLVPPEVRALVLTVAPESRAAVRQWIVASYDVRGAIRARGSAR